MLQTQTCMKPYPMFTTCISGKSLPDDIAYQSKLPSIFFEILRPPSRKPLTPPDGTKRKLVQTMYRESETQTEPFKPDIIEPKDKGLEILTLSWLSLNNGLPAGMIELQIIERARQRRAWENAFPIPYNQETLDIRKMVLTALEANEWKFREDEIKTMGSLQKEIAEKMIREGMNEMKKNSEDRINRYTKLKVDEKITKLQKARLNFNRNLRKLVNLRNKVVKKYHRWNVIKEHRDKTSELYGPQMRFGDDPKRWHEKINPDCRYWNVFNNVEVLKQSLDDICSSTTPKPPFDHDKNSKPKKYPNELCVRETKWTESRLAQISNELRENRLRKLEFKECRLKVRIPPPKPESEIPTVEPVPEWQEELYQSSLLLQKVIKGRAIQAVMFEGRVRCQELLEEVKSTHALQGYEEETKGGDRKRIFALQRENEINNLREKRKQEILQTLQGKTMSDMLDFLSKELLRLQDERVTHAFALLADGERHKREAAEAGRRQQEDQRRRESDEMFKQIVKLHQNTVDIYLEDIIIENGKWLAERTAREYIHNVAKKVDRAAQEAQARASEIEELEIVADLIHNYALPEAQKQMVRKRLNDRQRNYLRICHDEVYSNIEHLVQGKRSPKGELLPLERPKKHKVPPLVPIKFLRLSRAHGSGSTTTFASMESVNISAARTESVMINPFGMQLDDDNHVEEQGQDGNEDNNQMWSTGFSRQDVLLKPDD